MNKTLRSELWNLALDIVGTLDSVQAEIPLIWKHAARDSLGGNN
jgi:hypothetical protein